MTNHISTEQSGRDGLAAQRPARISAAVAVILVAAIAVTLVWLVLSRTNEPTVSFDGTVASYTGPDVLDSGIVAFTLENSSDGNVSFGLTLVKDTWTLDDAKAYEGTESTPPWIADRSSLTTVGPNEVVERDVNLRSGIVQLHVWDRTEQLEHIAGWIEVTEG